MSEQLVLDMKLRDDATLDNFVVGANQTLLTTLQRTLSDDGERYVYVWGEEGAGRSHLLQACCHALMLQRRPTTYLPLAQLRSLSTELLDNLESMELVAIDDIDAVVGDAAWEEALFHFYNRLLETKARLLVAAAQPPANLAWQLPDLKSRLSQGAVFQLQVLDDDDLATVLTQQAAARGLSLPREVAQYLLHHYPRNMHTLAVIVEQLDRASLEAKRRLTVPFVKSVLEA